MFHPEEKRPKVGLGVIIVKGEKVLMGKRINSHGANMWCFPGGHLEWNESWEQCAVRETKEEAGVEISNVRFLHTTNDVMFADSKHYITIHMVSDWVSGEPVVNEPDEMVEWSWFDWDDMPEPVFLPIANLLDSGVTPFPQALTPDQQQVVSATKEYVKARLEGETSGHGWWHSYRVWKVAKQISKSEECDRFVVELAAILHDISDYKLNGGDVEAGPRIAKEWLEHQRVEKKVVDHVVSIIGTMSFKGARVDDTMSTIEGMIVQDADRMDALGAIGIARCFAFGGHIKQPFHDPNVEPHLHDTFEEYSKKGNTTSINRFYENLLLLKDRMKTKEGKQLAQERHAFLESFLEQFHSEWDGGEIRAAIGSEAFAQARRDLSSSVETSKDRSAERGGSDPESIWDNDEIENVIRQEAYDAIKDDKRVLPPPPTPPQAGGEFEIDNDSLKEKLLAESKESKRDESPEEIANVFEVIDSICKEFGFDEPVVENLQQKKRQERGGFDDKVILESTRSEK